MAQITSALHLSNERGFRKVDFGALPLGPISLLQCKAGQERREDREERLNQLRDLPLTLMAVYCKELPLERSKVECLLCRDEAPWSKDNWMRHFRRYHWQYYFSMLPKKASRDLGKLYKRALVPREDLPQPLSPSDFSADKWITIEDIERDVPIISDESIIDDVNQTSVFEHYLAGPVLIQRFVVVKEGQHACLCLGIHTCASDLLTH